MHLRMATMGSWEDGSFQMMLYSLVSVVFFRLIFTIQTEKYETFPVLIFKRHQAKRQDQQNKNQCIAEIFS